ncbi:MAG: urease accessory protein UreF [Minwuia sp.]|uniref:urease accessory protein UreF n=1 Tax=Minwuia sp. TaxID=2493630 RepID=UPI003A8C5E92
MNALLQALQHADTAFPNGGFAFSQGLEGWSSEGGRPSPEALFTFIAQQISHRWACADRLALLRAHAAGDLAQTAVIDAAFDRTQTVAVLAEGSRRNGRALLASHRRLGTRGADEFARMVAAGGTPGHLPVVQGAMWRAVGMDPETAVLASAYAFASGQIAAAIRLNLIGAIAGQGLLSRLLTVIEESAASEPPEDYCGFTPFAEIAAMRGATGESRLFSN